MSNFLAEIVTYWKYFIIGLILWLFVKLSTMKVTTTSKISGSGSTETGSDDNTPPSVIMSDDK